MFGKYKVKNIPSRSVCGLAIVFLSACVMSPSVSDVPEVLINGQKAYIVSAGGSVPFARPVNERGAPNDADIAAGMNKIRAGNHGAGLPKRASVLCPQKYTVVSSTPPVVRPEGHGVWSMSSKFTIICK